MLQMIVSRIIFGALTLLLVATIIFVATELLPGDAALHILGRDATAENLAAMRERLGLGQPSYLRYLDWLGHLVMGDLGTSFGTNMPVAPLVADRLWNTMRLAAFAALLCMPLGFLLGVRSAIHAGSVFDRSTGIVALVVASLPEFFLGLSLVFLFAVQLGLFPAIAVVRPGQDAVAFLRSAFLPALTLALSMIPHLVRMTRAAIMAELTSSYVETSVLKGVSRSAIIWGHVLPNVLGSLISTSALILAYLIAGVVVVETAFAFPGIGRLMVDAVANKDMPLIQASALVMSAVYVVTNLLADLYAMLASPRIAEAR